MQFSNYTETGDDVTPRVPTLELLKNVLAHPEATPDQKSRAETILTYAAKRIIALKKKFPSEEGWIAEVLAAGDATALWEWPTTFRIEEVQGAERVVS